MKSSCLPKGWVTAAMASLLHLMIGIGTGTVGILMVEFVQHFHCTKADVSLVGGTFVSLVAIGALFFGEFLARFGPQITGAFGTLLVSGGYVGAAYSNSIPALLVTLGLIAGLGTSCFSLASNYSIQRYCMKWRASASGIMLMGLSIGVIIFPPWTGFLIREYNWRGALLINGGIILNGIPCSMLLGSFEKMTDQKFSKSECNRKQGGTDRENNMAINSNVENKNEETTSLHLSTDIHAQNIKAPEKNSQVSKCNGFTKTVSVYIDLMKKPKILLMILSFMLIQFGHLGPYAYLPMRAGHLHFSKEKAAMLVTTLGIVGAIGRLGAGLIGNYFSKNRILIFGLSGIITGGSSILSVLVFNAAGLFAYGASFALFSGFYTSLRTVVMMDLIGIAVLPQLMAMTFPLVGVFQLISISTSGLLIDATSNVEVPFLYFGSIQVVGGVLSILLWRIVIKKQKEKKQDQVSGEDQEKEDVTENK